MFRYLLLILASLIATNLRAETASPQTPLSSETALRIGVKVAPPFVMQDDQGIFHGISIELWHRIAQELEVNYEFVAQDLNGLIAGLQNGSLDASVAALTVTAERAEMIDFSHPFHTTGLAIAASEAGSPVTNTLKRLFSLDFLTALGALVGVLMLVGLALWLVERKKNAAMFGGKAAEGIGSSFWWAAVTMTTVGYGDKAPITFWGRVIALVWMFAAIIIISSFTAAIATSLTVGHFSSNVQNAEDLPRVRVATLPNSAAAAWLEDNRIRYQPVATVGEGLDGIQSKRVDAVVYDKPLLQYTLTQSPEKNARILPGVFLRQDYAIALPKDSTLREALNVALLKVISAPEWQRTLDTHLGLSY